MRDPRATFSPRLVKLTAEGAWAQDDKVLAQAGQGEDETVGPTKRLYLVGEPQLLRGSRTHDDGGLRWRYSR
jgi:hypothetical protein